MTLLESVENAIQQKRMLNEATEYENSKEVITEYAALFENLSDTLNDTSNKATLDGNGKVSEDLRKAEVNIIHIKKLLKTITGSKSKERLSGNLKKAFGEMANSLKKIQERFERDIMPEFEQDANVINPDEDVFAED
jgi:hypothetical protein